MVRIDTANRCDDSDTLRRSTAQDESERNMEFVIKESWLEVQSVQNPLIKYNR